LKRVDYEGANAELVKDRINTIVEQPLDESLKATNNLSWSRRKRTESIDSFDNFSKHTEDDESINTLTVKNILKVSLSFKGVNLVCLNKPFYYEAFCEHGCFM